MPNGKPKGTAAVELHVGNITWGNTLRNLGEMVTKFDAQLSAFQLALALTEDYLNEHQPPGLVYILNSAKHVIMSFVDTRPGPNQPAQLALVQYTNSILQTHADTTIRISWFKYKDARSVYKNTKRAAINAVKKPTNPNQNMVSINYQCQQAKVEATRKWEERWHASPGTSLVYCTACTKPPDRRLHTILHIQQKGWKEKGETRKAKYLQATMSTLFRIITGHAFTGEYTMCFLGKKFPTPIPEELVACQLAYFLNRSRDICKHKQATHLEWDARLQIPRVWLSHAHSSHAHLLLLSSHFFISCPILYNLKFIILLLLYNREH